MSITIPSSMMGQIDAELIVEPDAYGDRYSMELRVAGDTIARGEGFGPGMACDFATDDDDEARNVALTVGTFGAFLLAAVEGGDDGEARNGWPVLDLDRASDWTDALSMMELELNGDTE